MIIDNHWDVKPEDYTDLSQADILKMIGENHFLWTESTGWMYYNGSIWEPGEQYIHLLAQDITRLQKSKAEQEYIAASQKVAELEIKHIEDTENNQIKAELKTAAATKQAAQKYLKYAVQEKQSSRIRAAIDMAQHQMTKDISIFDRDPYLLNCPSYTVNLLTGEQQEHSYRDYITKCTATDPGTDGQVQWQQFLDRITAGDRDIQGYLQSVFGKAAIGEVHSENLIILYGKGGNGKSTLTNAVRKVMGDYAIQAEPQLLITSNQNKAQEMEVFRGARLALSAELEYGVNLDSAMMKRLTSTDNITCNPKYHKPYSFTPTHTLLLSTNYLPRVNNQDKGTWDRIVVVPLTAQIRGQQGEITNYAKTLVSKCGPAILSWVIQGARNYIAAEFKLNPPDNVQQQTEDYHRENDRIQLFISEYCDTGSQYSVQSSILYSAYRDYCSSIGAIPDSQKAFTLAIESKGYQKSRTKAGIYFKGLHLNPVPVPDSAVPDSENLDWDSFIERDD